MDSEKQPSFQSLETPQEPITPSGESQSTPIDTNQVPMPYPAIATPDDAPVKSGPGLLVGVMSGIVIVIAIFSAIALWLLTPMQNSKDTTATTGTANNAQRAKVATSAGDYETVCDGGSISNAAAFSSKATAVITSFSQSPRNADSWSYESVGYGESYYVGSNDFAKINTVACLEQIKDSKSLGQTCDYRDGGKTITVKYYSHAYKLTFYEAKSGKKLGDGGVIGAPALKCPSFVAYDPQTLSAYAAPDDEALEIAYKNFVTQ